MFNRLERYVGYDFLKACVIIFIVFFMIVYSVTFVEIMRKPEVSKLGMAEFLWVSVLQIPFILQKIMPFIILLGGLWSILRLTRHHELIIMRAFGFSHWRVWKIYASVACIMSVVIMTLYSPFASHLLARYYAWEMSGNPSSLNALSMRQGDGLWLRQSDEDRVIILHAAKAHQGGTVLKDVTLFQFQAKDNLYRQRIYAGSAVLKDQNWELHDVKLYQGEQKPQDLPHLTVPTPLTQQKILDHHARVETVSFWQFPAVIRQLEQSGFNIRPHLLAYYDLLFMPCFFVVMVTILIAFAPGLFRLGGVSASIIYTLSAGFAVVILYRLAGSLGVNDDMPLLLAFFIATAAPIMAATAVIAQKW